LLTVAGCRRARKRRLQQKRAKRRSTTTPPMGGVREHPTATRLTVGRSTSPQLRYERRAGLPAAPPSCDDARDVRFRASFGHCTAPRECRIANTGSGAVYSVISSATPRSVGGCRETKPLRGLEVDDELEFGRLLNRQITRLYRCDFCRGPPLNSQRCVSGLGYSGSATRRRGECKTGRRSHHQRRRLRHS
jgi:hypothetical protein